MFNRKWSEEIVASFSFISSSVPTFINTLILRFISIIGTKYLMLHLHISPQEGTLVPIFVYFNSPYSICETMGRGPKYFSLYAIDHTTGEGALWRVGKFKPLFLTKRKQIFLLFSLTESQLNSHRKPFNFLKNY